MSNSDKLTREALQRIASCSDSKELQRIADNARAKGVAEVVRAAQLRLYEVSPAAEPGTVQFDVWRSIFALEGTLAEERGTTVRLSRTRQKIARDGEALTVAHLVVKPPSDGFRMLKERNMLDYTFEAVALRHPASFSEQVIVAARTRLANEAP